MPRQAIKARPVSIARQQIEDEIERLIAILDGMEPDPDLEDGADSEPWLGAAEADQYSNRGWVFLQGDDLEDQCDDEGAQPDDEPSDNGLGDADGLQDAYARAAGHGARAS